ACCNALGQQTLRCALPGGIRGAEEYKARAESALSDVGNVTSIDEMSVFLCRTSKGFYLHSNYKPLGAEAPMKLAVFDLPASGGRNRFLPLEGLVENLIAEGENSPPPAGFETSLRRIKFIIEQEALEGSNGFMIDAAHASNFSVLCNDGKTRTGRVIQGEEF